jgi:hypothetical protein
VCLLVILIIQYALTDVLSDPLYQSAHQLLRPCYLISLFIYLIGIDTVIYSTVPVNYAFIFGIEQKGRYMEGRHFLLVASQLSTLVLGLANGMVRRHCNALTRLAPLRSYHFICLFQVASSDFPNNKSYLNKLAFSDLLDGGIPTCSSLHVSDKRLVVVAIVFL